MVRILSFALRNATKGDGPLSSSMLSRGSTTGNEVLPYGQVR